MSDHTEAAWSRLAEYVSGALSPEQMLEVERWIAEDPERAVRAAQYREAWSIADAQPKPSMNWTAIEHTVLSRITVPTSTPSSPTRRSSRIAQPWMQLWRRPAILAAATAVVLMIGTLILKSPHQSTVTLSRAYQTALGERLTVRLVDGSSMTLAPATTVRVRSDRVRVSGEAYFSVANSANRPFVVETGNATVRVLGTRFVVRQYATEQASRVVVEDGRVSLVGRAQNGNTHATILNARMLAAVTDSGITATSNVLISDYTSWMQGRLVFKNTPLRDVVAELARAYDAEIRLTDTTLARQPMTLQASVDQQPLSQVLDFIGRVTDAHYTRSGKIFVLLPGRAATRSTPLERFPQSEKEYGR